MTDGREKHENFSLEAHKSLHFRAVGKMSHTKCGIAVSSASKDIITPVAS